MKLLLCVSVVAASAGHWNASLKVGMTFSNVDFTHCGTGATCGGHQTCSNYELALSDAYIWNSLGVGPMAGGYDSCPGGNWQDCCQGSTSGVCSNLPSCPLDGKDATAYPVCITAANGNRQTAFVTGCCPSRHPCNVCKAEIGDTGACRADRDQADLCDNLWQALGSPDQSTSLDITIGACGEATTTTTTHPGDWKRCRACTSMCAPCKECWNRADGLCERCWHCYDYKKDRSGKDEDSDCLALSEDHDWSDTEVQCLSDKQKYDCRQCWRAEQAAAALI